jgi:hypothetical protein
MAWDGAVFYAARAYGEGVMSVKERERTLEI